MIHWDDFLLPGPAYILGVVISLSLLDPEDRRYWIATILNKEDGSAFKVRVSNCNRDKFALGSTVRFDQRPMVYC